MSSTLTPSQLLNQLNWRYATKQFDPSKKIPAETWDALEDALVLTPSSFGIQPWEFIVVKDPAVRENLKAASWNQGQVADASHLVVFAVRKENTETHIREYIDSIATAHKLPADAPNLAGLLKVILGFNKSVPNLPWNTNQAYIALGNFMTSAAVLGIDTCPLEGIDPAKYDGILGLGERGLATTMACVAGYRSEADKYASLPKVRFAKERIIRYV